MYTSVTLIDTNIVSRARHAFIPPSNIHLGMIALHIERYPEMHKHKSSAPTRFRCTLMTPKNWHQHCVMR